MTDNKKKPPVNTIVILAIILSLLTLGVYSFVSNKYGIDKPDDTVETDVYGNQIVTLKYFTYKIPKEVGYVLDEDKNTIVMNSDENNWYANIEYMYDPNNVIFNNYDKMERVLNYNGYNVTETRKIILGANDIYLFDMVLNNEKATVFYQRDTNGFTYEITLYTEDINHSEKAVINKIIGILNNAKFDDTIEIDEEAIDLSHSLSEIENN